MPFLLNISISPAAQLWIPSSRLPTLRVSPATARGVSWSCSWRRIPSCCPRGWIPWGRSSRIPWCCSGWGLPWGRSSWIPRGSTCGLPWGRSRAGLPRSRSYWQLPWSPSAGWIWAGGRIWWRRTYPRWSSTGRDAELEHWRET